MKFTSTTSPRSRDSATGRSPTSRRAMSGADFMTGRLGWSAGSNGAAAATGAASCAVAGAPAPVTKATSTTQAAFRQQPMSMIIATSRAWPASVQQHVVRPRRSVRRLREIDGELRIELQAPVRADIDEPHHVARRKIDAADRGVRDIEPAAVPGDVHHVGLDDALHRVVEAGMVGI